MSSGQQLQNLATIVDTGAFAQESHWYAVQTRGKHEKKVATALREKGIETFLPLLREVHRWSDRNKVVEVPLFPCYTFVQITPRSPERLAILHTDGVIRIVSCGGEIVPVDRKQIDDIRLLLNQSVHLAMHPYVRVGQRVVVRGRCLDGVEGILTSCGPGAKLIVSVETIQRSIALSVDGYEIEPIESSL